MWFRSGVLGKRPWSELTRLMARSQPQWHGSLGPTEAASAGRHGTGCSSRFRVRHLPFLESFWSQQPSRSAGEFCLRFTPSFRIGSQVT